MPSLHILLVENHEDTVLYLRRYLEQCGHSVSAVGTVSAAKAMVEECAPDVLLCDIGLPDGDGWGLLSDLKERRPQYCIAMSGYGMAADIERSREAGYHRHLTKPFLPETLDAILAEL